MKLVIAEKPSVAASIAKVIGATERKDGYFEGNGYMVSWCVGHLVGLSEADKYGEQYKKWDCLPIIPQNWSYEVKPATKAQFNTLKQLMRDNRVDALVCATDAGREGELIFRHTYNLAGCKKSFLRLWISSLEDSAIKQGFEDLKNGTDYDDLYKSALCRERADWLVGINATRFFTTKYNSTKVLSVGRVQSPTLTMIVERDEQIANFVKEKYYTVELDCGGFTAVSDKIKELTAAESLKSNCDNTQAIVTEVKKEAKKTKPPKLYDLTSLQRDANRLYGFTANQTLQAVQSLYDNKLSTYPRTDSQYLTEDMEQTAREIIGIICKIFPDFCKNTDITPNIKVVMDNKKVSDHHAIIPTANIGAADLSKLTDTDKKVLYMIAHRLLTATAAPFEYESTQIKLNCADAEFKASGRTVTNNGYKAVEENFKNFLNCKEEETEDKDEKTLPEVKEQQAINASAAVAEHYTTPPKPYTEDTLLSAMERAGNNDYDTDEVERKGLGTPATRAGIIEGIITRGYVERNKKQLISTDKGKSLVKILPDKLKSAKLTADWENKLVLVSKGSFSDSEFMQGITEFVVDIVGNTETTTAEATKAFNDREVIGKCPRCGNNVYEGKLNFYCENKECEFTLWKKNKFWETKKKEITKAAAKALLSKGKVRVKDLYSEKTGKTYEADILLDDTGGKYVNFKMEFPEKKK